MDPANEDDDGHGTHVASTIASPINGLGIAGVAPNVTLVNIRAGQDSGYFFLEPTLEALDVRRRHRRRRGQHELLHRPVALQLPRNPADIPPSRPSSGWSARLTQRAVNYAMRPRRDADRRRWATRPPTSATRPSTTRSPDFPRGRREDPRTVDNSCITVPTETRGVIAVSSTGISKRKAYYSNYGTEQTDVAAPGGDVVRHARRDPRTSASAVISPPTRSRWRRLERPARRPTAHRTTAVRRPGLPRADVCGYYQYLQGTSMASPHAVGVAALIVSRYGHRDGHGG